jgi:aminoglycoside N3'-acetyltransferase
VLDAFDDDPFALIVDAFLARGLGSVGTVGEAPTALVSARAMVDFAVQWFEASVKNQP